MRAEIVQLLVKSDDISRALSQCERWLVATAPEDRLAQFELLTLKRHILQTAEREDELIRVGERLLELQPEDPGLNNDLAYSWADRGERLDRCLKMIKLAVAAEPLNAAYLDSLGWVYYKQGQLRPGTPAPFACHSHARRAGSGVVRSPGGHRVSPQRPHGRP